MRRQSGDREPRDLARGVDGVGTGRERAIAERAAQQRGVVTRDQLLDAGLTPAGIDHRLRSGRLHALYRGVYLLGHAVPPPGARELGAVLACGPGSVASHRTAAAMWKLLSHVPGEVDVTVAGRRCESKCGIRVHRTAALHRRDVRRFHGIPITTPARTLLDLAGTVASRDLERAFAEAHARRLTRRGEMLSVLARVGPRPGVAALRSLIEADAGPAFTRSEAEDRFLALIRAAELPEPEVNVRIGRHQVDVLWRERRLVVEVDGFAFHSSRAAFERDRRRDAELVALGFRVIRVSWREIVDRPEALVARLAAALG
jgi:very-short-patch-repair endonuclease